MSSRSHSFPLYRVFREASPEARGLALLIAFTLVRGLSYAVLNPPFQSPDENSHFEYVTSLYQSGGSQVKGAEAHQPPLYYWIALPVYALVAGHTVMVQLLAIRLVSVLMTVGTVVLAYKTARLLRPNDAIVCYGTALFVALVPTYGLIGASANNDNLAILASSAMIYLLARAIASGFTPTLTACLLSFMAVGVGAKATTLPVVAVVIVALIVKGMSWGMARRRRTTLIVSLAGIIMAGTLALAYGLSALQRTLAAVNLEEKTPIGIRGFLPDPGIFVFQFKTFWATFYTDSVWLPSPMYLFLAALGLASMWGLAVRLSGVRKTGVADLLRDSSRRTFILQLLVAVGVLLLVWLMSFVRFVFWNGLQPPDQSAIWNPNYSIMLGRFLFPAIVPIAFFSLWGLTSDLLKRLRWRPAFLVILFLLVVDWTSLAVMVGNYYGWQ